MHFNDLPLNRTGPVTHDLPYPVLASCLISPISSLHRPPTTSVPLVPLVVTSPERIHDPPVFRHAGSASSYQSAVRVCNPLRTPVSSRRQQNHRDQHQRLALRPCLRSDGHPFKPLPLAPGPHKGHRRAFPKAFVIRAGSAHNSKTVAHTYLCIHGRSRTIQASLSASAVRAATLQLDPPAFHSVLHLSLPLSFHQHTDLPLRRHHIRSTLCSSAFLLLRPPPNR